MTIFGTITDAVRRSWRFRRARAELSALDDRILKDIGVDRAEIDRIARQAALDAVPERAPRPAREPQGVTALAGHA